MSGSLLLLGPGGGDKCIQRKNSSLKSFAHSTNNLLQALNSSESPTPYSLLKWLLKVTDLDFSPLLSTEQQALLSVFFTCFAEERCDLLMHLYLLQFGSVVSQKRTICTRKNTVYSWKNDSTYCNSPQLGHVVLPFSLPAFSSGAFMPRTETVLGVKEHSYPSGQVFWLLSCYSPLLLSKRKENQFIWGVSVLK